MRLAVFCDNRECERKTTKGKKNEKRETVQNKQLIEWVKHSYKIDKRTKR